MSGDCPVRKVEPKNIRAGLHQFAKHLGGLAGGTNGADDFRAAHVPLNYIRPSIEGNHRRGSNISLASGNSTMSRRCRLRYSILAE
jgi:hypothetical protein